MQEIVMSFRFIRPASAVRISVVAGRVAWAACSVAAISLFAANVQASEQYIEEKIVVRYADLDLSQQRDVGTLYSRLRDASNAVCGAYDVRDQRVRLLRQICYETALETAVADVNRAAITDMHAKAKRIQVAHIQVAQGELSSAR
jgi:UrcA family protein